MTSILKLYKAAEAANYEPQGGAAAGWRALLSDGSGTEAPDAGMFGVWGYEGSGGPLELLGMGATQDEAFSNAADNLQERADNNAAE